MKLKAWFISFSILLWERDYCTFFFDVSSKMMYVYIASLLNRCWLHQRVKVLCPYLCHSLIFYHKLHYYQLILFGLGIQFLLLDFLIFVVLYIQNMCIWMVFCITLVYNFTSNIWQRQPSFTCWNTATIFSHFINKEFCLYRLILFFSTASTPGSIFYLVFVTSISLTFDEIFNFWSNS
jgi:hypothetical protein